MMLIEVLCHKMKAIKYTVTTNSKSMVQSVYEVSWPLYEMKKRGIRLRQHFRNSCILHQSQALLTHNAKTSTLKLQLESVQFSCQGLSIHDIASFIALG